MQPASDHTAPGPGASTPVPGKTSLAAALEAAAKGYRVFPCRGKVPYYAKGTHPEWAPPEPADEHGDPPLAGLRRATSDAESISKHWPTGSDVTVGAVAPKGVVIFDVDVSKDANRPLAERQAEANARYELLRDSFGITVWVGSPNGGYHGHAVRWPTGVPVPKMSHFPVGSPDRWGQLRGDGTTYVILPGGPASRYRWVSGDLPNLANVPIAAPELVALIAPPKVSTNGQTTRSEAATARGRPAASDRGAKWAAAALVAESSKVRGVCEGGRREALNSAAFALAQIVAGGYLTEADVTDELLAAVATQRPPLPEAEAVRTIADAMRDARKSPRHPAERTQAAVLGLAATDHEALGRDPLDTGPPEGDAPTSVRTGDVAGSPASDAAGLVRPPGWNLTEGCLTYRKGNGDPFPVYRGDLTVEATGTDDTGAELAVVRFTVGRRTVSVPAPLADLARARPLIERLAARGAPVHEGNARLLAGYLTEYTAANVERLPRRAFATRYGSKPGGIVGPGWSVGAPTEYGGELRIEVLGDGQPYRDALGAMASWEAAAWPTRLLLGLAVTSPHLAGLGAPRNPLVYASGQSNRGKTLGAAFATGLYGNPTERPLSIHGPRSTSAGILQMLEELGGLPAVVDEAHVLDLRVLQDAVYSFGNRQGYTRGNRDGRGRKGGRLSGALFLTGEAHAALAMLGAHNRVLHLDVNEHPMFGAYPEADRAAMLDRAVTTGHGGAGEAVTRYLWEHRTEWIDDVRALASQLASTAPEWHLHLAAAEVSIRYLRNALDLAPDPAADGIASLALGALEDGRRTHDPSTEAWEEMRSAVLTLRDIGDGGERFGRDGLVAVHDAARDEWLVKPNAREVVEALERFGGLRMVGAAWSSSGKVKPSAEGKTTAPRSFGGSKLRVLVCPAVSFDPPPTAEDEADERTAVASQDDASGRSHLWPS